MKLNGIDIKEIEDFGYTGTLNLAEIEAQMKHEGIEVDTVNILNITNQIDGGEIGVTSSRFGEDCIELEQAYIIHYTVKKKSFKNDCQN